VSYVKREVVGSIDNSNFILSKIIDNERPGAIILVPHIDSRVKIIDNERPGASPCALTVIGFFRKYKNHLFR